MSQSNTIQPAAPSHVSVSMDADELTAQWSPNVGKVIVDVSRGVTLYLTTDAAGLLADELLAAVSKASEQR